MAHGVYFFLFKVFCIFLKFMQNSIQLCCGEDPSDE